MELVLVVPRKDVLAPLSGSLDGFHAEGAGDVLGVVARKAFFVEREGAEEDPELKQIIPYAVVVCGGQVFLLRRLPRGAEPRLHDKVSLGVGGHVNPGDAEPQGIPGAVEAAFRRELHEELRLESRYHGGVVGVVNDDSNAVGRVHLGIVYRVEVDAPAVTVREQGTLEGRFVPREALGGYRDRMESWSRLILDRFWPQGAP
ncbi:MAG: NUDIX domain-containing protein [Planctomycetes bacterium]|nr:NUDIX domain-containing protein [Planctomycetota bacterium]